MPSLFSRLKGKDGATKKKKGANFDAADHLPAKPRWDDAYTRKTVEPEEIQDLIRRCTEELKARGTTFLHILHVHASIFVPNATYRDCKTDMLPSVSSSGPPFPAPSIPSHLGP